MLYLLLLVSQLQYPPALQADNAQEYHRAVVRIFAGDGAGRIAGGTGVLVAAQGDQGIVLTCWHNVKDGAPFHVEWPGVGGASYRVLDHSDLLDLAVLWVGVPDGVEPIPLADKLPLSGSKVELAGYGGGRWLASYPEVRGYHKHRLATPTDIGLSFKVTPGESGSPVISFEHRQPRVAGIAWGGMTAFADGSHEFAQATDALHCLEFLQSSPALRGWQFSTAAGSRGTKVSLPRKVR